MVIALINALGGVGLFLFGMVGLTEGLQALAGSSLRRSLARFTNTPISGALTGAVATAIIQSSSATTVTAVGLVGAGLLSFPQALGIVFGANLGTTVTGWLAALLGFKLDLGQISLPLVFLGALARLFGGAQLKMAGTALAGFALIFLGIEVLKTNLAGLEGVLTPADLPRTGLVGTAELFLIGAAMTFVTQSSSAGVATALALIGADILTLPQAMALVIGMDVGTTGTAALATLGGSIDARRTGLSHVLYNCITAAMALLLLPPAARLFGADNLSLDPQFALVAFHSGFNLLGLILILPFARPFARMLTRLIREKGSGLTSRLGSEMLQDPQAATDVARSTLDLIVAAQFRVLSLRLSRGAPLSEAAEQQRSIGRALEELTVFVDRIPAAINAPHQREVITSILHSLDHMRRLHFRAAQDRRIATLLAEADLGRSAILLHGRIQQALKEEDLSLTEQQFNRLRRLFRAYHESYRSRVILGSRDSHLSVDALARRLEAVRWLHRVAYHLWRIAYHRDQLKQGRSATSHRREAALSVLEEP